jgi:hypothetical protein
MQAVKDALFSVYPVRPGKKKKVTGDPTGTLKTITLYTYIHSRASHIHAALNQGALVGMNVVHILL